MHTPVKSAKKISTLCTSKTCEGCHYARCWHSWPFDLRYEDTSLQNLCSQGPTKNVSPYQDFISVVKSRYNNPPQTWSQRIFILQDPINQLILTVFHHKPPGELLIIWKVPFSRYSIMRESCGSLLWHSTISRDCSWRT